MSSLTRRFRRQNSAGMDSTAIPYLEPLPALRWNQYVCPKCFTVITTVESVDGTTPMQIRCTKTVPLNDSKRPNQKESRCQGLAQSQFYPKGIQSGRDADGNELSPTLLWKQPTKEELRGMPAAIKEHVRLGGLLDYRVAAATAAPTPEKEATPPEQATMEKAGISLDELRAATDSARAEAGLGVGISTRPNVNRDRASVRPTNGPEGSVQ